MTRYLMQRLLFAVPTVLLLSVMVFSSVRLLPGNAVHDAIAESGFAPSDEQVRLMEQDLGLDRPAPIQYFSWIGNAARGRFGSSFVSRRPVSDSLRQAMPVTFELALLSICIALIVAVPLGTLAALERNSVVDLASRLFAIGGVSLPSFVLGMAALLFGLRVFNWVPPTSYRSFTADPWRNIEQLFTPALVLGYALSASVMRLTRSTVLEVLNQDYVRTAHAKGLAFRTVVVRHVLRNALLPVLTVVGVQLAAVLGGAVIIESIFNLPGLGQLLVAAVIHRDYPVVQATVLVVGVAVILTNLAVDLSYGILNPQIRYG